MDAADIDADGWTDLLATSALDGHISWYPNADGQGNFGRPRLISSTAVGVAQAKAADLDGDGDLDVVAAIYDANEVLWYENIDGQGNFGPARAVTDQAIGPSSVFTADIDGDGQLDVLSTSAAPYDADVSWYRNEGQGVFGAQRVITVEVTQPMAVAAADIDGDGDLDVLSASYGAQDDQGAWYDDKVAWYENTDGQGVFGEQRVLGEDVGGASAVTAADVDGDGDLDVVFGTLGEYTGQVAWLENQGGGQFGSAQQITQDIDGVESLDAADLDGDEDLDLISASFYDNKVAWYENQGGGVFGEQQLLADDIGGATSAVAADLDGDGDSDVALSGFMDDLVAWSENTDSHGNFAPHTVVSQAGAIGIETVAVGDLDGDGDPDVLAASVLDGVFSWFENIDGQADFGPQQPIGEPEIGAIHIEATDLDGDNDLDLLTSNITTATVAWYENLDGQGQYGPLRVISEDLSGTEHSTAADLDGDGDLDVLASATDPYASRVVWFENLDGDGQFSVAREITADVFSPRSAQAVDLDGDDDLDVVVVSIFDNRVTWYENTDGLGTWGSQQIITLDAELPWALEIADLDADGHPDVVVGSFKDSEISWFRNMTGAGDFGPQQTLSTLGWRPEALEAADLDRDGDLDLVSALLYIEPDIPPEGRIAWYENTDGRGTFAEQQVIESWAPGASGVVVEDLDGDGDPDLLASMYDVSRVTWYRNESTPAVRGDFDGDSQVDIVDVDLLCSQILTGNDDLRFDLTGDGSIDPGDLDELVSSILGTTVGDANLNGIFNSSDMVQVFQRGEYEDGIPGNSTWAEGDWNCDGEFNSTDMVVAFQRGGYVAASHVASRSAPSRSDLAAAMELVFRR